MYLRCQRQLSYQQRRVDLQVMRANLKRRHSLRDTFIVTLGRACQSQIGGLWCGSASLVRHSILKLGRRRL